MRLGDNIPDTRRASPAGPGEAQRGDANPSSPNPAAADVPSDGAESGTDPAPRPVVITPRTRNLVNGIACNTPLQ